MRKLLGGWLILSAAGVALAARPAAAAPGSWQPLGPDGGTVYALAVDPRNPRIVYAGTEGAGVFRTLDGGTSWAPRSRGLGGTPWVIALAIDPAAPATLYAATEGGFFKSTDAGGSWALAARGLPYGRVNTLLLDPRDSRRLYIGTAQGVFRSLNGGASWQPATHAGSAGARGLALDPATGLLYAATDYDGVWESRDGGRSFRPFGSGLAAGTNVFTLLFDPGEGHRLLAGTSDGIYVLDPVSHRWVQRLGDRLVEALAADRRSGRLFAGGPSWGVATSRDHGVTWQSASAGLTDPGVLALAVAPGRLWAGTFGKTRLGGVFASGDAGGPWRFRSHGITALGIVALAASPHAPGLLFAAAGPAGFLGSHDGGHTWQAVPGFESAALRLVEADPGPRGTIYADSDGELFRSGDQGKTWTANEPGSLGLLRLRVDRQSADRLWGTGSFDGLERSEDAGFTWVRRPLLPAGGATWFYDFAIDPADPSRFYAAGGEIVGVVHGLFPVFATRLYRSTDSGETWERRDAGLPASGAAGQVVVDPNDPTRLYAVTADGLYRSRDGGDSWQKVAAVPLDVLAVAAAPTTPTAIYVTSAAAGCVQSLDGGDTFHVLSQGLDGQQLRTLVIDPQDPKRILGASVQGGVFALAVP